MCRQADVYVGSNKYIKDLDAIKHDLLVMFTNFDKTFFSYFELTY